MGTAGRACYEQTFEPTMLTRHLIATFTTVIETGRAAAARRRTQS
jgi:hypothetical protein